MNNAQKEITLQVLEKLKPHWSLAEWLSVFVQSEHITDEALQAIATFLQDKVKKIKEIVHHKKLKDLKDTRKKEEQEEREQELNHIEWLLDTIM